MKKHFTLILTALVFTMGVSAQILPNGDMESWLVFSDGDGGAQYNDLGPNQDRSQNFLRSLNQILTVPGTPATCFKETSSIHGGASAAKLVSGMVTIPFTVFVPGTIVTGDVNIILQSISLGRPFNQRPDRYTGWYKYAPVNGDSAKFEVILSRYDALNQVRVPVGSGSLTITQAAANYTNFNIDIVYTDSQAPDTAIVVAAASAGYDFSNLLMCQGQVGSELFIDDLSLEFGGVGINEEMQNAQVKVFPTATSSVLNIQTEVKDYLIARVYDLSGKKVLEQSFNGTQTLDVSSLTSGNYIIVVQTPFEMLHRSKFQKI